MHGPRTRTAARIAGLAAGLTLVAVSAAAAAGPGSGPGTAALQEQASVLDSHAHSALLDLYALDSQLAAAQSRLGALQATAAQLRAQQARLTQQLAATRKSLATSQFALARTLRTLYVQSDDSSVLAVVLGATSLAAAVTKLDDLTRVAEQSSAIVAATRSARMRLVGLRATLASHRAQIDAAVAAAQRTTDQLASTRSARLAFISRLRSEERLKTSRIHALELAAQQVQAKSEALQAAAATRGANPIAPADPAGASPTTTAPAPLPAPATAPGGGRTLVVSSTGYSLPGHTASGLPVGWGIVAVDPSVIPLGTRLTIPGYGEAVAADTGSAVRGLDIDLWFPTLAQARAWGRRTVTITLH
ncbi:MAG: 3D domain-containing protein [Gaiellaceae bacterium]